jgi:hypothetical protein
MWFPNFSGIGYSSSFFSNTTKNIVLLSYCEADFRSRILNNTLILNLAVRKPRSYRPSYRPL